MAWNYYALEKISQERQNAALQAAMRDQLIRASFPDSRRVARPATPSLARRLLNWMGTLLIGIGLWLQSQDRVGDLS
ncbi:MAG TPA: hypothetical protein VFS50_03065 [Meiothermus sp.]|jgi:hypothetical protein|nr:hypothetical protein [Meiothermus sp.]